MRFDALPADLAHALDDARTRLGGFSRLRFLADVDSTNDVALTLALAGEAEGTAVLSDVQRAGRGRRGHDWFSPAGAGLYLSIIVRPRGTPSGASLVTLACGVAVARAVRSATGLPVELKWPNDVVIGRPWRKLGGVLCEAVGAGPRIDAVVLGIGLNLLRAAYPRSLADRATSIEVELGRAVERAPLVVEALAAVRGVMDLLHQDDRETICDEWRRFGQAGLAGAPVRWRDQDLERSGRARAIDVDGALLVERDGRLERVIGGDVEWEAWPRG